MISQMEIDNIQKVEKLWKCQNEIEIGKKDDLNEQIELMKQYEQRNKKYKIMIDLSNYMINLDMKMKMIECVDLLNVNHRVGTLKVVFTNINPINKQLMTNIVKKYEYLYRIEIEDRLHAVDVDFHDSIKQIISQSTILEFVLKFKGNLKYNNEGLKLLKSYNKLISDKQHLKALEYGCQQIMECGDTKQKIQEMIDRVNNM